MSLKVDPRDRKLLLAAGFIFLILLIAAAVFGGAGGEKAEIPSTYSTASGGAKAAYLLLEHEGYKTERWELPLDRLPLASGTTLIVSEPDMAPTPKEREQVDKFLDAGGRIIAAGMFAGTFLPENSSLPDFMHGATWEKAVAVAPSEITRAAPEIHLAAEAQWPSFSAVYPLYANADQTVVVEYPHGRGEVLWWASATPLTNAGLKEAGNLEFFLACLGDRNHKILWDEYIHGYRNTLAMSMAHSPLKWLALQLAFLGLAVLATFSRRSGPISKPTMEVRLSPLEFVQTLGEVYQNAGTASVALDICYQRFRYWLTRRLGVANNISIEDLEAAVVSRRAGSDDRFAPILRRCESAKGDPNLSSLEALHLIQELDEYASRWKLFQGNEKEKGQ
jgi:Domain of unknown function (DUF4350)